MSEVPDGQQSVIENFVMYLQIRHKSWCIGENDMARVVSHTTQNFVF